MKVSIIIPTYNRNEMLCKTIANILIFEHQYHELIIVDQTKDHDSPTQLYLDSLISNKKIKYLYVDYPNLPNARNIGIKNSLGDIVLFFDDDVKINENTIPAHISGFYDYNISCVTGRIIIENTEQNENKVFKNRVSIKKIIKSLLFLFLQKRASYVGRLGIIANFSGSKTLPSDTCIGCNMSFRKEVFEKCGLFDVKFSGNAVREETDISVRLNRNGYKIMYIPEAAVVHYMNNSGGTRAASSEAYWSAFFRNQCYFYLKNFSYSYLSIFFIQVFELFRCRRQGLKVIPIFRQAYKSAYRDIT